MRVLSLAVLAATAFFSPSQSQVPASRPYSALVDDQIQRLEAEVDRVRQLVNSGTLARARLQEAEEKLADARDEGTLSRTLYGGQPVDQLTDSQADEMLSAAKHRVDRQSAKVEDRRRLLESGAIASSEFELVNAELQTRQAVLVLAENRKKLLEDLRTMAEAEKRLERTAAAAPHTLQNSMLRYNGNGAFSLADMPAITSQFEARFHEQLPVSALGQTLLHQSLGLDHRNRVDVGLSPESPEGQWLRAFLERLHIPYLAFRSAVAGAATAPHIHIGLESTRLKPGR